MREYSALKLSLLPQGSRVAEPQPPERVTLDDPAFAVMTDLRDVAAVTTRPDQSMHDAHALMLQRRVRLLFVLEAGGAIAGVITATDLLGEKPMRFIQGRGVAHGEITVGDIMTPASMLEAMAIQ